jgi:molecular chaperone GrpE (heat shock protein)
MHDPTAPKLSKWPFFLGDVFLFGAACFIVSQSTHPMTSWQIAFIVLCVAGGACSAILPFLLEYRLLAKLVEIRELAGVVSQVRNLENVASQITSATNCWNTVQAEADKTAGAAKEIAERMAIEMKGFTEFMQRANESEKATLRLEVDKFRRAEGDWVQVLVRMLDHAYALQQGALRSGQPNVIQQVGNFQNACRDAARRVGLTPFLPDESEPFDPQRHQLLEGDGKASAGAAIAETIATGYTYQGRMLRPALVRLSENGGSAAPAADNPPVEGAASQLPSESGGVK